MQSEGVLMRKLTSDVGRGCRHTKHGKLAYFITSTTVKLSVLCAQFYAVDHIRSKRTDQPHLCSEQQQATTDCLLHSHFTHGEVSDVRYSKAFWLTRCQISRKEHTMTPPNSCMGSKRPCNVDSAWRLTGVTEHIQWFVRLAASHILQHAYHNTFSSCSTLISTWLKVLPL